MSLPKLAIRIRHFAFIALLAVPLVFPQITFASVQNAASDPDINITLRNKFPPQPAENNLQNVNGLIDVGGDTDPRAPQLNTISTNPSIKSRFQVGGYLNGAPTQSAIPADNSNNWGVTLSGLTNSGDVIKVPQSGYDIGEGYQVVILYATNRQITISYTNGGDGIVRGYTIHILDFNVDPNLVSLYQQYIGQGKVIELPCGYALGTSTGSELVSIRDTGSFMDPRSRKDWWNPSPQLLGCNLNLQPKPIVIGQSSGPAQTQPLTTSQNPIPDPYVGGGDTENNEFHSLRPYQASPFGMLAKYVEEDTLFCGNDILVKQSYIAVPNDQCDAPNGSSVTCHGYVVSGQAKIEVDLKDADLPIVGNTQLVPNRINKANLIDDTTRVNEYLSWYLNGTVFSAYDNPLTNTVAGIDRLVNFSGPLNKLLPASILDFTRARTGQTTQYRHNQIYECLAGGNPVSCAETAASLVARLQPEGDDHVGANPPLSRSPYSPLTPMEDRAGEVRIPSPQDLDGSVKPVQPIQGGIEVNADTLTFTPDSGISEVVVDENNTNKSPITARNDLYFAHVEEASNLAQLLQTTFKPNGEDGFSGDTGMDAPYFNSKSGGPKGCEIGDAVSNPGDDLFGDFHQTTAPHPGSKYYKNISGTVNYTTKPFDVTFNLAPDPECEQQKAQICATNPTELICSSDCTNPSKKVDIYAALAVYTKAPKINEIAERLVGGDFSVLGKFFPQDLLTKAKMEDKVASSKAIYKQPAGESNPNIQIMAGDPSQGRSGNEALIFFPHLGSVYNNFLQGLQCALRPQGMCGSAEFSVSAQASSGAACTLSGNTHIASPQLLALIEKAAGWANVPPDVLLAVFRKESCGGCAGGASGNPSCSVSNICSMTDISQFYPGNAPYACGGSGAKGPMQYFPSQWENWKSAVTTATGKQNPNICNLEDAIYAGALHLSAHFPVPVHAGDHDVNDTASPSLWTLEDKKRVLTWFAGGNSSAFCGGTNPTTDAEEFASFYCGFIDAMNTESDPNNVSVSCNQ